MIFFMIQRVWAQARDQTQTSSAYGSGPVKPSQPARRPAVGPRSPTRSKNSTNLHQRPAHVVAGSTPRAGGRRSADVGRGGHDDAHDHPEKAQRAPEDLPRQPPNPSKPLSHEARHSPNPPQQKKGRPRRTQNSKISVKAAQFIIILGRNYSLDVSEFMSLGANTTLTKCKDSSSNPHLNDEDLHEKR
jgi:hypothetical protein